MGINSCLRRAVQPKKDQTALRETFSAQAIYPKLDLAYGVFVQFDSRYLFQKDKPQRQMAIGLLKPHRRRGATSRRTQGPAGYRYPLYQRLWPLQSTHIVPRSILAPYKPLAEQMSTLEPQEIHRRSSQRRADPVGRGLHQGKTLLRKYSTPVRP